MTTESLAYYIWDFLRRHDGERPALENWLLAEQIMAGNRPAWLFDVEGGTAKFTDFKPFENPEFVEGLSHDRSGTRSYLRKAWLVR